MRRCNIVCKLGKVPMSLMKPLAKPAQLEVGDALVRLCKSLGLLGHDGLEHCAGVRMGCPSRGVSIRIRPNHRGAQEAPCFCTRRHNSTLFARICAANNHRQRLTQVDSGAARLARDRASAASITARFLSKMTGSVCWECAARSDSLSSAFSSSLLLLSPLSLVRR